MDATKERIVLAMGWNSWGKGKTETAAIKAWRLNAVTRPGQKEAAVVIVDAPAIFEIDDDGTILRHPDSPPSMKVRDVKVKL